MSEDTGPRGGANTQPGGEAAPPRPTSPRPRSTSPRDLGIVVAIVALVVGLVGGYFLRWGTEPTETAKTMAAAPSAQLPVGGFTFAEDDLCEWITPDEVAGFFAAAFGSSGVTAKRAYVRDSGPDQCTWRVRSTTYRDTVYEVWAGKADGLLAPVEQIVEYPATGVTMTGDPALSDGVVYQEVAVAGIYSFWVPPRYEALGMRLNWTTTDGVQRGTAGEGSLFPFADQFLH